VNYRLTPQATRDIARASAWWQQNRPEAPSAVLDEVAEALEQIVHQPESGVAYGTRQRGLVRRVSLPMTKRYLYYSLVAEVIVVLRVCGAERAAQPRFGKKTSLS
jgi:plasmid stabilization system protein ParE